MDDILVTIGCVTYNQKDYIRDALDGFLKQKTNFKFEIFVYDDASTDGTSDILMEYAERYPELFRIYISDHNRWRDVDRRRFLHELRCKNWRGKYVALCEGDDYWIDEHKLQIQADYMEAHPECSMYIHNCCKLNCEDNVLSSEDIFPIEGEKDIPAEQLIREKNGHPPTASYFYRKELMFKDFFFFNASVGDYPLVLCAAAHGTVHYSSRKMSVYRWKARGSYTTKIMTNLEFFFFFSIGVIDFLVKYNEYTKKRYEQTVIDRINEFAGGFAEMFRSQNIELAEEYKKMKESGYYLDDTCIELLPKMEAFLLNVTSNYLSESIKKFIQNYKNIIIMGTGKYSQILTEQLEYNRIPFHGYAVSSLDTDRKMFNGKKIWNLKDIPYSKEDTGVLVGILVKDKEDIINSLNQADIKNFCLPFEFIL